MQTPAEQPTPPPASESPAAPPRETSSKRTLIALGALLVIIALVVWVATQEGDAPGVALRAAEPRAGALPVMWQAPAFSLPDQNGATIDQQTLLGKVWIVDFIFTSCGNTCPRMTARRVELQKQIPDPNVMFLSISVDPERDDAETRKHYGEKHSVDQSRWHFVSPADRAAAMKLATAMKIAGNPREEDNPILHADRFILIDATGRVRGIYHLDDQAAMKRLASDATSLARAAK